MVNAGDDLQAAIDAAQPGDTILLEPGATFVGSFTLSVKSGNQFITIRTAPDPRLPPAGRRINPAIHAPLLAKLRSINGFPVLKTVAGSHHYKIELVEFEANVGATGDIILLGRGGPEQNTLESVPHNIIIDRCYIHGDPLIGQKRGISLQSAWTSIINSHISDIKAQGIDTQAIGGGNGPGPFLIENNYLEAAGENVMFGGSDPKIPNLVPSDITFRYNHVAKPRSWQQPIMPPTVASAVPVAGGGSLAPGTYAYRVIARRHIGQGTMGFSPSTEISATLSATGGVQISWAPVPDATEYRVYGRTAASQNAYWLVTGTSFVDTGAAGTAGTPPGGSYWMVKNLLELKNASRVLIEGNVFEHNWIAGQGGVGIVMTPRNQDGTAPWSIVSDVTFRYNIVRHTAGGMSVNGFDTNYPSQPGRNIRIEHNLFYDVVSSTGRMLIMGNSPEYVTIEHNTHLQSGTIVYVHGKNSDGTYDVVQGFRFANNLGLHNNSGITGENAGGLGLPSIRTYFLSESTVVRNVIAGGVASKYPADNLFPTVTSFMAEFADAEYRLRSDSPYKNAGTDGKDLGADIDGLMERTSRALSGDLSTPNAPPTANPGGPYGAPTLTTIVVNGAASTDAEGPIVSYVWSWGDSSADSTGVSASHQYARSGTYTALLTVTDEDGATGTATTAVVVTNRTPIARANGPYSAQSGVAFTASAAGSSDADGSIATYRWSWGDGSADTTTASPSASHTYAAAGTYSIVLTVTDDEGAVATATATVSVSAPAAPEIVLYTADLPTSALRGHWFRELDPTAAGGARVTAQDAGWSAVDFPWVNPTHYFETTFQALANTNYRVWLRLSAGANSKWNDSVWVQFSSSVNSSGTAIHRIGTAKGLLVNLATTSTATELNGWGWHNGAYWLSQVTTVRFATAGTQRIRIQTREDGVSIDQIVISPARYLTAAPGPRSGDQTIVPKP